MRKLRFTRRWPIEFKGVDKLSAPFYLFLTLSKAVDPESGMSVNLKDIDAWFSASKTEFSEESESPYTFLLKIRNTVSPFLEKHQADLEELRASNKRQEAWILIKDEFFYSQNYSFINDLGQQSRLQVTWKNPQDSTPYQLENLVGLSLPELKQLKTQNPKIEKLQLWDFFQEYLEVEI